MSVTTGTFPGVRIVDMPDLGAVNDASSVIGEHAGSGRFSAPALRAYATTGSVLFVTSVAALRALATGAASVFVQGYYTAGDGGGGDYVLGVTGADNGGSVIVSGAGTYYLQTHGAPLNVLQFGAKGDGATDDAPAVQAAATAAVANGTGIYFPRTGARYAFGSTVTITGALTVTGDGGSSQIIQRAGSPTVTLFTVTTTQPCVFSGLYFGYGLTAMQTAGAAILFDTGTNSQINYGSTVSNCWFIYQNVCVDTERAAAFHFEGNQCTQNGTGLIIRNLANEDAGDNFVTGNMFEQDAADPNVGTQFAYGVIQYSSGGLKLIGNKFLGHAYGFVLSLDMRTITATSDLIIQGNSFENMTQTAITVSQKSGSVAGQTFDNVQITGNQIAFAASGILFVNGISGNNWVSKFIISENIITVNPASSSACINILGGQNGYIGENVIGGPGTATGINTANSVFNTRIGNNVFLPGLAANIFRGSGTDVNPIIQTGTVSIAPATAYGSLFKGTAAISFSHRQEAIVLTTILTPGGGGIGSAATGVSVTTATVEAYAINNTSTVVVQWSANGY